METSTIPFDKFKVVRKLGRGGMGTVYEAQDPALERRVAIKTLTTDAFADAESRKRFEREARAAAKLQHPNIVTIYELGNFGRKDKPYIVMEYLEGSDLTSFIGGEHPMAFGEALDVAAQLCRALDFAHQHDVVHRDVKPSNIRLLDDGRVKIMDFGIARIEGGDQITRSGVMVGTPHYMSPEQIKGGKIDGRSDVFSAGCILYEMLAGRRPFHGDTAPTVLYKIVNEPPPPLLKKKPNLPQEVEDVLNRALAKNPEDRFQSAGEMAAELDKLLRVHHLSFPRVPADLQKRLDRLERCRRDRNWSEARAMARELVTERPELPSPRRILRTADRMLRLQEEQSRLTPAQKTRDLVEISDELTQLYGPGQQPTVVEAKMETRLEEELTAGKLKLRTKAAPVPEDVRPNALLKIAAAVVVIAVLGMGAWYIFQSSAGPQQITQTVRISSEPPGSSIFVNGVQKGVVTETGQRVEVLLEGEEGDSFTIELRKAGYSPVQTQVQLGAAPPPPLELTLDPLPVAYLISTRPAGATVRLDGAQLPEMTPVEVGLTPHEAHELALSKEGYESQTLNIGPGEEPPGDQIMLVPLRKPGTLVVKSLYPLSVVSSGGGTLAGPSTSPSVKLAPGKHQITLYAPGVFLNKTLSVEIREASSAPLEAPPLGKVSIRAVPGNCSVRINGIQAEAPPILNQDIVAGSNTFVFEWPSGQRQVQTEEVRAGRHAYVTGQTR